ncbi:MAG: PadR family transcriptional regulator [Anaerolineaceae bacterium]|nr:PadR family transcriptional regulator [Anaerolineaceae bacterium]
MSVRMVILGLLTERQLYGYEIKQIIEEHMGDWTSIAFGSIYFALDKLAEEGFVDKVATEQAGSRPSRSVYKVTNAGKDEFLRLLRESWQSIEHEYFEIDVCLFFLERLSRSEVKGYLRTRLNKLERILGELETHETKQFKNPDVPAQARAIFEHSKMHIQSEVNWTRELLNNMEMEAPA